MAKRKHSKHKYPTLSQPVPGWVGFAVLIAVLVVAVKLVKTMVGMGY